MYLCHLLLNLFYTFPSVNPITNRLIKYVFRSQVLKKQKRAGCCNSHCHHTGFTFYNVYISHPLSVFIFEWIFSMCACVCMWLIVKEGPMGLAQILLLFQSQPRCFCSPLFFLQKIMILLYTECFHVLL